MEDKQLLLQDLSARLPYGVKCYKSTYKPELPEEIICILKNGNVQLGTYLYKLEHIKPYLFPLSSMTFEQEYRYREVVAGSLNHYEVYDWLNQNHFDYRGLIEKGLAIDATGLNIY